MTLQQLDNELLVTHDKLRATDNIVLRHRLLQKIDQLLDRRLKLTRP